MPARTSAARKRIRSERGKAWKKASRPAASRDNSIGATMPSSYRKRLFQQR
jgi:hypothetical protein